MLQKLVSFAESVCELEVHRMAGTDAGNVLLTALEAAFRTQFKAVRRVCAGLAACVSADASTLTRRPLDTMAAIGDLVVRLVVCLPPRKGVGSLALH